MCNSIRCVALIGKYKMRKLYIILSVINKSVYLTGNLTGNHFHLSTCTLDGNGKKRLLKETPLRAQSCGFYWLTGVFFSDAVKIPCHKYEIKGLSNYFERGREGGGGVLERASQYGNEVLCIHFLSRYQLTHLRESFFFFSSSFRFHVSDVHAVSYPHRLPRPFASSLRCDILNSFYPK